MPDPAPDRPSPADVNDMVRSAFPASGNECVELGLGWALARRPITGDEIRPGGFISGPAQFAIADAALWYAVFAAIGRIEPMAMTSELSIRYLRPATGTELWSRATIDVAGRRNIVGSVRTWTTDPGRPTSVAQGTYALPAG